MKEPPYLETCLRHPLYSLSAEFSRSFMYNFPFKMKATSEYEHYPDSALGTPSHLSLMHTHTRKEHYSCTHVRTSVQVKGPSGEYPPPLDNLQTAGRIPLFLLVIGLLTGVSL